MDTDDTSCICISFQSRDDQRQLLKFLFKGRSKALQYMQSPAQGTLVVTAQLRF